MRCGNTNRPAPKLFTMLPSASSLCTGAQLEPAQLSYWKADSPGGTSGFAPQRSTTHTERPSLSTATALSAPHLRPSGSLPHGAAVRYGFGRSLTGLPSHFHALAHPSSARAALAAIARRARWFDAACCRMDASSVAGMLLCVAAGVDDNAVEIATAGSRRVTADCA